MAKELTDREIRAAKGVAGKRVELFDSEKGLVLRVGVDGGKHWSLRYRLPDGGQRRYQIGSYPDVGAKEARDIAADLKAQIRRGEDPSGERRRKRHASKAEPIKSFDDLVNAYWTACESGSWQPRGKKKRARTLEDERGIYRRHLKDPLGAERVEDVSRALIRQALRTMTNKGIGAQAVQAHALLRQVFNFAVHEERLLINPALNMPRVASVKARERVLKDAELKAIWQALKHPETLRAGDAKRGEPVAYVGAAMVTMLQLLMLLPLRKNEVAGMKLSELDLAGRTWTISGERMKGGRPHLVPLGPKSVELIKAAIDLAECESPDKARRTDCVFPGARDRHRSVLPGSISHAMLAIRKVINLDEASPHDLRRTISTVMTSERLGVSPFIRSKVLGHTSDTGGGAAVSSAHYDLNSYGAEKRRALEAWEALLLEIVGEKPRTDNVTPLRSAQ